MEDASPRLNRASLTVAKEARKRAELDAQLLANRIALLKQEEEKAWKKIEEPRKRAGDITTLRGQNEQKYMAKEQFYKQKWEAIRSAQSHNAYMRDQGRKNKGEVAKAQLVSQDAHMEKKQREASERSMNSQRTAYIKNQRD